MTPWSERIPAALAKAAAHLEATCTCARPECCADRGGISDGEVSLVKAFWARYSDLGDSDLDYFLPKEAPSLIAFAEKVEAL